MLQIGICDYVSDVRLKMRTMLERLLEAQNIQYQIFEFSSGEGLLSWYGKHSGELDLVFLDIEMDGMNGMEAAKTLRSLDKSLQLMFVTGYTNYVFDVYAVGALGYLIKPPKLTQLEDGFVRIHQRYLVRAGAVERIDSSEALVGGETLPVSRAYSQGALLALAKATFL